MKSLYIAVVALLCLGAVPCSADRIDDLEKMMQDMAKQNTALQQQVQSLQTEVQQLKATPMQPAGQQESGMQPMTGAPAETGMPKWSWGADIRMRGVTMDNMWTMGLPGGLKYDDSWEWIRFRTRVWFNAELTDGLSGYIRAANEYKWGLGSKASTLLIDPDFDSLLGNKELTLDNAYIDWQSPLDIDWLDLRVGRQDLIYGEGFVVLDGQSNVGSFLIGFDAAKATITLDEDSKSSFDLIYAKIFENNKQDADDEDLYGLYARTDVFAPLHLEPYLLHRNRNAADTYTLPGGVWPPTLGEDMFIDPEQDTTMLGLRAVLPLMENRLLLVAEGGYQWGDIEKPTGLAFADTDSYGEDHVNRRAWGGYAYAKYTFTDASWKPYIKGGYVYLSGDDPDTEDYEGWDSFYAEWPKWSEGMIYHLYDPFVPLKMTGAGPTDRDLGSWTNMKIAQIELGAQPTDELSLSLSYQYLWSAEKNSLINPDSDDRGSLIGGMAGYQFNKYLSGHLKGEWFIPGDFYDPDGSDDPDDGWFARYELMLKY